MNNKYVSRVFSRSELEELERQKAGDFSDERGVMSSRLRPKLRELLDVWFPRLVELSELAMLKKRGGRK